MPDAIRTLRRTAALLPLLLSLLTAGAQAQDLKDPKGLVSAAVQSELNANRTDHTAFIYRDHDTTPDHDTLNLVVETPEGLLQRRLENNGHPLNPDERRADDANINALLANVDLQRKRKKDSVHDDQQAEDFLKLLPVAFIWTLDHEQGELVYLNFKPDPNYNPSTLEQRVLSALAGQIVISLPQKRIRTIKGALVDDVKFGYGLFGRLHKGGSFQVERREVAPRHWQVTESRVHLSGHALFFKNIGDQEDEIKTDFRISPAETLKQADEILKQSAK
ncbi:hypothetical protein [Granulicella tundricola]|uniref:Uncharacterized protein n=1 Tax=Granulicella tundricola (strain ATCC BAA-1859 / DSM 23138 / MP5ACTX9) TaxID=1198114 RepID=E8X3E9_GRATM|nr:hypothetical protein [Granulicella tundricola]ADW70450.1 hypothetical protein AciX9_3445 [Granulicella tundricola MP5ACTX9]